MKNTIETIQQQKGLYWQNSACLDFGSQFFIIIWHGKQALLSIAPLFVMAWV